MKARDIMTQPVITVSPETIWQDVIGVLLKNRISGVPVVDERNEVIGMITEADLILRQRAELPKSRLISFFADLGSDPSRMAEEYRKAHGLVARDLMTREVISVKEDTPVEEIAAIMLRKEIKRVLVLAEGKLVGIISRADVLRAIGSRADSISRQAPVRDEDIVLNLRGELEKQPWFDKANVRTEASGGVVYLSGLVESQEVADAIGLAARRTTGVVDVRNDLAIASPHVGQSW